MPRGRPRGSKNGTSTRPRKGYGMVRLSLLIRKLNRFQEILQTDLMELPRLFYKEIISLVRQQIYAGETGDEEPIQPPYSPRTVRRKKKQGKPYNRVTLYDTGAFYKSFRLNTENREGFSVVATKPKAQEQIFDKYGNAVMKISQKTLAIIVKEYFRPELKRRLEEYFKTREGRAKYEEIARKRRLARAIRERKKGR